MPAADEQQMIQHVKDGNREAFRILVERHMKQAYNIAFGFVNNHDDAQDIAQESFVRVYQSIGEFRGDSGFGTWLYRIVANLSLNRLRKKKSSSFREITLADDPPAPGLPPAGDLHQQDVRMHVERALHELPTLQRAVVILRHLNGLSTRQVSVILRCSEGTVKTHLHRGLKKMRSKLSFIKEDVLC